MKLNLKENRKQREMLEMIDNVIGSRNLAHWLPITLGNNDYLSFCFILDILF